MDALKASETVAIVFQVTHIGVSPVGASKHKNCYRHLLSSCLHRRHKMYALTGSEAYKYLLLL